MAVYEREGTAGASLELTNPLRMVAKRNYTACAFRRAMARKQNAKAVVGSLL